MGTDRDAGDRIAEESRHGPETEEEREFSRSLEREPGKTRGFLRDLLDRSRRDDDAGSS